MAAVCRRISFGALLAAIVLFAAYAAAQGSGGSIVGTVTDQTQGVLPGVTVSVSGPNMAGTRSVVSALDGTYRLPNLPPGSNYVVVFNLPGFSTFTRQGIRLDVGFTATINATLGTAGVKENITVSGASPVVDATASNIATHLDTTQLQTALVGSRDYAAVISVMPGVIQTKTDVGGAGVTTMQPFRSYGLESGHGQIEGIDSSAFDNHGILGYSDMEGFSDMAVNLTGNSAQMPVPGVFVNVVIKSGGNTYHGRFHADYEPGRFSATNIDQALIDRGLRVGASAHGNVLDVHDLNKFELYRGLNGSVGGFLVKDKVWWFGALRYLTVSNFVPTLIDGVASTKIPALTGKLTWNMTPNQKLSVFDSYAQKILKNYGANAQSTQIYSSDALTDERYPDATKGITYNAVLGSRMVLTVRAGHWGDYGDYRSKGQTQRYQDVGTNRIYGSVLGSASITDRPQVNGSLSYFKNGWGGNHSFQIGGQFEHTYQTEINRTFGPSNTILYLNNNVPTQVDVYQVPNATVNVARAKSVYLSDDWRVNARVTLNLGYRFDQYTNYVPAQTGPQGHDFPQIDAPTFNVQAPRLGVVYALTDDQKTLLKVNYGVYYDKPGFAFAAAGNPNPNSNYTRYEWIDPTPKYNPDGLPVYEGPQQLGRVLRVSGANADFSPSVTYDPHLKDQYSPSASLFVEREVAPNFGIRSGVVWNGIRNAYSTLNINQPFEAFTGPVSVPNPGPDGKVGTADDGAPVTAYNLGAAHLNLPVVQMVTNDDNANSDYYTWEITATRRMSNHWSLLATFSNLWSRDGVTRVTPNALINTTDGRNVYSEWQFRMNSSLDLPYGINLAPTVRVQEGHPYAPTFNTKLNYNSSVSINASPIGDQRNDNVAVFDIRMAKSVTIGRGMSLQGFVSVYNIFNTNAVQSMTTSYGSNFMRPGTVTGPRIARIGMQLTF